MTLCIPAKALCIAVLTIGTANATTRKSPAASYLDRALTLIESKHVAVRQANWPQLVKEARLQGRRAKSEADTYPIIRHVLEALGQRHSFLVEAHVLTRPQAQKESFDPLLPAPPKWRNLPSGIGALWLPSLNTLGADGTATGNAYTAAVRSGLQHMDGAARCGWLIDLRQNYGGDMWLMLRGLDPLLGTAPFGYFARGERVMMQWTRTARGVGPAANSLGVGPAFTLNHASAPVAVIVGPQTISSGEMVAVALRGRSNVRIFGAPTAGFTTANERFPLSDGAVLVITTMSVRDRLQRSYDGPLTPDERADGELADVKAVQWLEDRCRK